MVVEKQAIKFNFHMWKKTLQEGKKMHQRLEKYFKPA